MNGASQRRPSRTGAALRPQAMPDPDPAASGPAVARPSRINDRKALEGTSAAASRPPLRRLAQRARAGRRWILAGGTMAAGVPAWALAGRADTVPHVAAAALIAFAAGLPYAITTMYEARQETLRGKDDNHAADARADAVAGLLNATHTMAPGLSGAEAIKEAERVRASARQALVDAGPSLIAMPERAHRHPGQPPEGRRRG